ncbi:ABC transporter permease [Pseudosulfitobacter sp. RP-4]
MIKSLIPTIPDRRSEASMMNQQSEIVASPALSSDTKVSIFLFALTVALILGSRIISPGFGGWSQAEAILILSSVTIIIAFGQGLVILVGGLDLSVSVTMSLGGILAYAWMGSSTFDAIMMLPIVLAFGGLIGLVNGLGVTLLKVPPFIMTLATSLMVYGAFLGATGGQPRGVASPSLTSIYTGRFLSLPTILWVMLVFVVLAAMLQGRSTYGRRLYMIGTNAAAASIAGLPVRALTISAYVLCSVVSAFAGVMMVGYASGATLKMGEPFLLPSIAAVIVGGASITGGRGSYLATVAGALLLVTITTIISAVGLNAGWRTVIYGAVILAALLLMREQTKHLWGLILRR